MKKNEKLKALILFSGGLDSILAVKVLREQNIYLKGIAFETPFFNSQKAKQSAKNIKLPLIVKDISKEFFKILKKPKFGYGKHLNPCLDCRILLFKQAKKILKKEKFDFLATGEVLGQRPFSQNKQALELTAKEAGVKKILLRPLSAKLLEPTFLEKKGLINREKLLEIKGRSRKEQIKLAKKYHIKNYPSPAGGCLLTYAEYSLKAKKLLTIKKNPAASEFNLLKIGRHFFEDKKWFIVGRNKEENETLEKIKDIPGLIIKPKNFKGPSVFVVWQKTPTKKILEKAFNYIEKYSSKINLEQ